MAKQATVVETQEPNIVEAATPNKTIMVKIRAPLARNDEQNLIIGINGKNWSIPQDGKEYEVPDYVAFEFERAKAAEMKFYERQNELKAKSKIV